MFALAAATLGSSAAAANAACTDPVQAQLSGGSVTIKFDRTLRKAVKAPSSVKLPVSSGCLVPDTGVGTISTKKSFTLKSGSRKVKLSGISLAGNRLKGKVGKKTVTLANLSVSVKVTRAGLNTNLSRSAKLAAAGRSAIDKALHTTALKKVKKLGTVSAKTTTNQAILKSGTTSLTPDPSFVAGMAAQGITIAPVAPATLTATGFAFPITGGKIDTVAFTGTISSSGGLVASKGSKSITFSDFVADLGAKALNGKVSALGGTSLPIADLDLTNATHAPYSVPGQLQFGGIVAKVNGAGSLGFQQFLGATVPAGTVIGTLSALATPR